LLLSGGLTGALAAEDALIFGAPSVSTSTNPQKIHVMGIWAHPDDEAGMAAPCGVWNDRYGIRCGIIMVTRGEGGSNSVGAESGPALGLRRENEDRASHVRSGTVDIFNLDRVDFYYNTSAPLTAQVWDATETLRRTVRILRETQPDILIGSTPGLGAGHGNHQYAQGRMVWEAAAAAADPTAFPEQLTGVGAVKTWQVKKIFAGGSTAGSGQTTDRPNCLSAFTPAASNPFTVVGTWTGYSSPYTWTEGNLQGMPAGVAKTWYQAGYEGGRAHATQARSMVKNYVAPTCQMYGVSASWVPMQPNESSSGGKDNAFLYGAVLPDPGGMPLGSQFYLKAADYFGAPGEPIAVTVSARSGKGTIAGGSVTLAVPSGWSTSGPAAIGPIGDDGVAQATLTVTPPATAAAGTYKIAANLTANGVTAYNDTRVQLVSPVEGRFARTGTAAEYDEWADSHETYVAGLSSAVQSIGAGESITVSVDVTNRSSTVQSGTVAVTTTAPDFAVTPASASFTVSPGNTQPVSFVLTHTDPTAAGGTTANLVATTTAGAITSSETMQLRVVPTTAIPQLAAAPTVDGTDDFGTAANISIAQRWEGSACAPDGTDCGAGSYAKIGWYADALYGYFWVVDDIASAPATPDRCFGHWLVDSVEFLLDPRGQSIDTSPTFKLGSFPFTDDPDNYNGNGADGACWSRDADNYQGFSTGPLAQTLQAGPNAPGVEVGVDVTRQPNGTYAGGGWAVEVKIPLEALPAAVGPTSSAPTGVQATNTLDPTYLGLNVTPYDSDTQDFIGQTRTAWSAFGSQQSEPPRWGHAYLTGYTPPGNRPIEAPTALIPDTALTGVESPQTISQSATRGGTISGVQPTQGVTLADATLTASAASLNVKATQAGTLRAFLWKGDTKAAPVWTSSCVGGDPYGFDACDAADGAAAPWGTDMGGRVLASATQAVSVGTGTVTIPLNAATRAKVETDTVALVSFQANGTGGDGVAAWQIPVVERPALPTDKPTTTPPPGGEQTPPPPGEGPGVPAATGTHVIAALTAVAANGTTLSPAKVTVTATAAGIVPSGDVSVHVGNRWAKGTLNAGVALITLPKLPAGTHSLAVAYAGDSKVAPAFVNAGTVRIAKVVPTVSAKVAKTASTKKPKAAVTVRAPGVPAPVGSVTVKVTKGTKTIATKTVKLTAKNKGKVTVTLPRIAKTGKYAVTAVYKGSTDLAKKTSKKTRFSVVR
jgi:LmbE family N-acetylglucosaminyl deacetylase